MTNARRTRGLAFFAKSQLLSSDEVTRALTRMAHEIVERQPRRGDASPSSDYKPVERRSRRRLGGDLERHRRKISRSDCSTSRSTATTFRAPRPAIVAHPHRSRSHRSHGGPRRRRPLHRAHDSRRAERAHRLGSAPVGATRGNGRSRTPRTSDPARLRRQEPADLARRGHQGDARGRVDRHEGAS